MDDKKTTHEAVGKLVAELQSLKTVPCAIHYQDSREERTGKRAIDALVKIGPAAVPALIQALKHQDNSLNYGRAWAARALGEIGDPRAVPALIKALKNLYEEVGAEAARALGKFDHPRVVPALIQALTRVSELRWLLGKESITYFEVNEAAAVMLGKRGDPQAVPALIRVLQNRNGNWRVRQKAIGALRAIGDTRAVPALTEVCQDKTLYFLLRHNAAEALEALGDPQAAATLIQALQNEGVFHEGIVSRTLAPDAALARVGESKAVSALVQIVQDSECSEWSCAKAIKSLRPTKDPQAVAALVKFLEEKDIDAQVCKNAVVALQAIGTPHAVLALIEVLDDNQRGSSYDAAEALKKIGPRVVPALIEAFSHPSREVRYRVVEVLGLIKDRQAVPALIQALTDEGADWLVRRNAAEALGLIGDPRAVPALIKTLHGVPTLVEVLVTRDLDRSKASAKALQKIMQHYSDLDLRAALPALYRLQNRDPVFGEVLKQIEAATGVFRYLPLPAAAPPLDVQALPRPADAPEQVQRITGKKS